MARKGALTTLTSQAGIQVLGLFTGILVARLLGPAGRGELATVIVWVSMLAYVGNFGLPVAYVYAAACNPDRARQLLGNSMIATLVQWPVLVVLGLLILGWALSGKTPETRHLAMVYLCLYVPLNLLTLYANAIQQGLGRYRGFNVVRLCVPVSYLLVLGVLIATNQISVGGVLVANLWSNLATLALALLLVYPILRKKKGGHRLFDLSSLHRDFRYGLSAHLGTLQPFTSLRIDVLLLTMLVPSQTLGIYMAALGAAGLIKAQGLALGMVVMPEVAKCSDGIAQRRVILRFAAVALLLGGATASVAVVWADPLVALVYGSQFNGASTPLRLLVLGAVAGSLHRVLADGLRGMGKPLSGTAAEFASLAVGVPAIFLLAQSGGASGTAIAVSLASAAALGVTVWALIRAPLLKDGHLTNSVASASGPSAAREKATAC